MKNYIGLFLVFAVLIICVFGGVGLFMYFESQSPLVPVYTKYVSKISPTVAVFSEDNLWSLIQKWRTDNGLQPYIKDQRLCAIAQDRVTNDPPLDEHAGFYKKITSNYYSFLPEHVTVSENLDENINEQAILNAWLSSATHLQNLQKPYGYSCLACKTLSNGQNYCDQIFSSF